LWLFVDCEKSSPTQKTSTGSQHGKRFSPFTVEVSRSLDGEEKSAIVN